MSAELGATDSSSRADTYDLNIDLSYGNSGSPVYLANDVVVGVVKGNIHSASNKSVFVPITWSDPLLNQIPGAPRCTDLQICVNAELARSGTEKFTVSGGARASGTGPQLDPATDEQTVCYAPPPGYEIEGSVLVRDDGNNGGRGSIGAVEYTTDINGRQIKACVRAKAWSEAKLFGAGGWQHVTLSGLIRKVEASVSQVTEAKELCHSGKQK